MRACADPGCPCQTSALAVAAAAEAEELRATEPDLFRAAQQWSGYSGMTLAASVDHLRRARDAFSVFTRRLAEAVTATAPQMERLRDALRQAGQLREEPPTDPRARALWVQRNRSTGPSRPAAGHARRPRTHPGNTDRKGA